MLSNISSFSFAVDDTAPQIAYNPSTSTSAGQADIQDGWDLLFQDSGFSAFPGQLGQGTSLHLTSKDGASFTLNFSGTSVDLYGNSINANYTITLDDTHNTTYTNVTSVSIAEDEVDDFDNDAVVLLASLTNLTQGDHSVTLTAHIASTDSNGVTNQTFSALIFDRAEIDVSTGLDNATITTEMIDDTQMQFTGSWSFVSDPILFPTGNHTFHATQVQGDKAQYAFHGTSVRVNGVINSTAGAYAVMLLANTNGTNSVITSQQLSAASSFLSSSTLFYASGLDSAASHTLTITNLENRTLAVQGMNVTKVSGGIPLSTTTTLATTSTSLNGAVLAAIIVGAIAGLVLLALLGCFFLWCRSRRRTQRRAPIITTPIPPRFRLNRSNPSVIDIRSTEGGGRDDAEMQMEYRDLNDLPPEGHRDTGSFDEADSGHVPPVLQKWSYTPNQPSPWPVPKPPKEYAVPRRGNGRGLGSAFGPFSFSTVNSGVSSRSGRQNRKSGSPAMRDADREGEKMVELVPVLSSSPSSDPMKRIQDIERQWRPTSFPPTLSLSDVDASIDIDTKHTSSIPFNVDLENPTTIAGAPHRPLRPRHTRPTTGSPTRDTLFSFLDFASSASSSIRAATTRSRPQSQSRRSIPNTLGSHSASTRRSSGSTGLYALSLRSITGGGGNGSGNGNGGRSQRSSNQLSLTLTIDNPASAGSTSQANNNNTITVPSHSRLETAELSPRHPFSFAASQSQPGTSPTESIPHTVSDINFRVEENLSGESEDRDRRFSSSHVGLPPHPPLPLLAQGTSSHQTQPYPGYSLSAPSRLHHRDTHRSPPHIAQLLRGKRMRTASETTDSPGASQAEVQLQLSPAQAGSASRSGSQVNVIPPTPGESPKSPTRGLGFMRLGRKS